MPLLLLMLLIMPFETSPYLKISDSFLVFRDFTVIKLLGILGFAWASLRLATGEVGGVFSSLQAKLFVVFYLGVLFAGTLSGSGFLPISRYLAFLLFMPFVFATVRRADDVGRIAWGVGIAYMLVLPYAVRQMVRYGGRLGTGVYETNYFAANLVLVIPIVFAVASVAADRRGRRLWAAGGMLLVGALLLTASRGGFLGLLVAACVYAYRKRGVAVTAGALVLLIVAALVLPTGLAERTLATLGDAVPSAGLEASNRAHIALFWAGLRMIADAPLTGVGPQNFKRLSLEYAPELQQAYIAHNTYLELAAELGLPVLALFLALLWQVFRTLGRATRLDGSPEERRLAGIAEGLRSGLLGFLVSGAFISGQYEKLFWVVVFLSIAIHRLLAERAPAMAPAGVEPEPEVGVRSVAFRDAAR